MLDLSISEYYKFNKSQLEKNYPGISERRLKQEFEHLGIIELNICLQKLSQGIPLEYITGKAYFFESEFVVDQSTLIPRFETEGLVELALKEIEGVHSIVDIGTGSGNIIISLLKAARKKVNGTAIDISQKALAIAKINYFRNQFSIHPESQLNFIESDLFDDCSIDEVDMIVSNPPYIKQTADIHLVHHQVDQYEPHTALYLKDSEYEIWFKKLFSESYKRLKNNGVFIMEGHENHLGSLALLGSKLNFSQIQIHKDLRGDDRYLLMRKLNG